MYKFTNGIVVFDEKTRDEYIKAGFKLVESQVIIDEAIEEVDNENNISDGFVGEEDSRDNKKTSKHRK